MDSIIRTGGKQYCNHCKQVTDITYYKSIMHIENICPNCKGRRTGKPFITKKKLQKIIENLPLKGDSNQCIHSEK